jgi:signal transduction histidine kinase
MQAGLVRALFVVVTLAALGLATRETLADTPALTAGLAFLLGVAGLLATWRRTQPSRVVVFAFFCGLVLLVTRAALDLGGAAGSALCFGFVPGFLAGLVLGPACGWAVTALMLASFAWLYATTPLPGRFDVLRFVDEVAMTIFTAGLAHALTRSFRACEAMIAARRAMLVVMRERRQAMTLAIYDELEPLATELVDAVARSPSGPSAGSELGPLLQRLVGALNRAKGLAQKDEEFVPELPEPDAAIRRTAMRLWLRLAAGLMLFFIVRNFLSGVPYLPSAFTLVFCVVFDRWLERPESSRHLEATALAIGLAATGPMLAHLLAYGAHADAPALVVMPGTVLFTALLSRGPAAWAVLALNAALVVWTGLGQPLSLQASRLLGDLVLSFVIVVVALGAVFTLRGRYARTLMEQGQALVEGLRQQRRLAGTLFHDVSNHLQTVMFLSEFPDPPPDFPSVESLSRRVQRLIGLSKGFLLSAPPSAEPSFVPVLVSDAVAALREAFGPRLSLKQLELEVQVEPSLRVLAQPDLLVESVLGNLLSNAIKFSPPGSRIRLTAAHDGGYACLVLRDSGPGLPAEVLSLLGHEGAVPSRVGTAGEQGQGYGLQLVREHVQRMSGRLELRSRPEGGTDAIVWLPFVP